MSIENENETFEIFIPNDDNENIGTRIVAYTDILGDQLHYGDAYIAKRNTGWEYALCKEIKNGCVVPLAPSFLYWYGVYECHKVDSITFSCKREEEE